MGKKQNLEEKTKVLKLRLLRDSQGFYLPYCDYEWHKGISKTPDICESRDCIHYFKLYVPKQDIKLKGGDKYGCR